MVRSSARFLAWIADEIPRAPLRAPVRAPHDRRVLPEHDHENQRAADELSPETSPRSTTRSAGLSGLEPAASASPDDPDELDELDELDEPDEPDEPDPFEEEKRVAFAMLSGIELGLMDPEETYELMKDADSTLVYFIFKWLKKHYHRDHDDHEVMRRRVKSVTNQYRALTRKAKSGEADPIVEWFEGTHKYRELSSEDFIDIIVDKLEG